MLGCRASWSIEPEKIKAAKNFAEIPHLNTSAKQMKILNFTISYPLNSDNLYSDLNEQLVRDGHEVKVVYADPLLESNKPAEKIQKNGVEVLRVKSMKVQKSGMLKKGISFLRLTPLLKAATKKFYGDEHFDLILFMAPPVTFANLVAWAKKRYGCPAFLMQKDIFPQNAVDLKILSRFGLARLYFRLQEIKMLKVADWIGCMSDGNIKYLLKHNSYLSPNKLLYFPNTEKIKPLEAGEQRGQTRQKYGIPEQACSFLFGGNMGRPQYLKLLCLALERFKSRDDVFFFCIGSGTDAHKLKNCIEGEKIANAKFLQYIPRADYNAIADACDVGIVTLNPNFTIPNYPSKTLSYMASKLPILAATDSNTDYRLLIEDQAKCGLWCDSSKPEDFFKAIDTLAASPEKRVKFGENGRRYYEEHFDVATSAKILENLQLKTKVQ